MNIPPLKVTQNILDGNLDCPAELPTLCVQEEELLSSDIFSVFDHARPLGISPGYSDTGHLVSLSIADRDNCRILEFCQAPNKKGSSGRKRKASTDLSEEIKEGRELLQEKILCRPAGDLYAFDMAPLTMALYSDFGLRIARAVDIQSAFPDADRSPLSAIESCIGTVPDPIFKIEIDVNNVKDLFLYPVYNRKDMNTICDLAVRAWISQFLPGFANGAEVFDNVPRISTDKLDNQRIDMISKIANDSLKLDQRKPTQNIHQVTQGYDAASGEARLISKNFNNRLHRNQNIRMTVSNQHGEFNVRGSVADIAGRAGDIDTSYNVSNAIITTTVTSIGRDNPTNAEVQRAATMRRILQGSEKLLDESPWIQNIWFPVNDDGPLVWPELWKEFRTTPKPGGKKPQQHPLNASQQNAVNSMLSEDDARRILLIQGPPGTGKTSVIASFVQIAVYLAGRRGIWLVAQSNVAVKNIAEKLISCNFTEWKLLVSKDFHFDWHEHLYTKVAKHIIRSDQFKEGASKSNLQDTHVMLCTLSMLSNRAVIQKFTREVPLRTMVVDEASQIEIGNYIPVFSNFKHSLRKVCFIGDDKQLPPFGQEEIDNLQSIFEVLHLKKNTQFLNIQYRMPPQIGRIISEAVYDNKLASNPLHPIQDNVTACYFIDIPGNEQSLQSGSWQNELEAQAVLKLAHKLQEQNKNYRIITPYEGQRSFIENAMKEKGLEWGDKCFNVDSFQGNEDDYIIVSAVRSRQLGFLSNLRRTNVMLTRCKKGMFIVSSLKFLQGVGAKSLVGILLSKMDPPTILAEADIEGAMF